MIGGKQKKLPRGGIAGFLFSSALKHFYRKCDSKRSNDSVFFALLLFHGSPEETNSSVLEFQAGAIGLFRQTGDQFHLHQ
jgi:hypothetical protein